jgi:hypothetical protein
MASDLEHSLYYVLRKNKLKGWVAEYKFSGYLGERKRRWRMDVCFPDADPPLAIEVQGGLYSNGKHSREKGVRNDSQKSIEWQLAGGTIIHATPSMIKDESVVELIKEALGEGS